MLLSPRLHARMLLEIHYLGLVAWSNSSMHVEQGRTLCAGQSTGPTIMVGHLNVHEAPETFLSPCGRP
jgi:hypothetical protein